MTSVIQAVSNSVTNLLRNEVLPAIVTWLDTERHVTVTIDDLMGALGLPRTPVRSPARPVISGLPVLPESLRGTGATPTTRPRQTTRQSVPTGPVQQCAYRKKRKPNVGQRCEKNALPGSLYCAACSKKKSAGATVTTPGPVGRGPSTEETLEVEPYGPDNSDLFREPIHGFIVRQHPDGAATAIGIDTGSGMVGLTPELTQIAISSGLLIAPQTTPVANSLPTLPRLEASTD